VENTGQYGVGKLDNPRVMEPGAGSGRFLGYEPKDITNKSERVAVELDTVTGRILKELYPRLKLTSWDSSSTYPQG